MMSKTDKETENQIDHSDKKNQQEVQTNDNKEITEQAKEETQTNQDLVQKEKDKFLRLFAEFENYKKRTVRERIELFTTANQELMTALLPVMDDFERGLSEIKKAKDKELLKGMKLIYDKLKKTLNQKGLSVVEVKPGDDFDADTHQAITQAPARSEKMKGKIIECLEKGYKIGDKIIRYPKVVTGK